MRYKITADEPERRTTYDASGGEKGVKLSRFDLIPVAPLEEVAKVYGKGAEKYAERNWEKGYEWSKSYASLHRHASAFWDGESLDEETAQHHLASVVFHALALMEFEFRGSGSDDRPVSGREWSVRDGIVRDESEELSYEAAHEEWKRAQLREGVAMLRERYGLDNGEELSG